MNHDFDRATSRLISGAVIKNLLYASADPAILDPRVVFDLEYGINGIVPLLALFDPALVFLRAEVVPIERVTLTGLQDCLQLGHGLAVFICAQDVGAVAVVAVKGAVATNCKVFLV